MIFLKLKNPFLVLKLKNSIFHVIFFPASEEVIFERGYNHIVSDRCPGDLPSPAVTYGQTAKILKDIYSGPHPGFVHHATDSTRKTDSFGLC